MNTHTACADVASIRRVPPARHSTISPCGMRAAMEALRLPLTPRSGVAAPRSKAPQAALRVRSRAAPARASLRLAPARAPRLQPRGRVAAPLRAAGEEEASAGRCALFVAATPPRSAHALGAHAAPAPRSGEAPAEAPPTPAPAPPPQPASTQLEAQPGQPQPLGPSPLGDDAVNFALYSKNASAVTLCLCVRGRRMQRAAGLHDPHVAFGALTACARADSWTRRRPSRPPSSRCAARVTCGTSPSRTSRAQACATVRSRGGTLRAALRSPLTAGAQVSRSAATAAGRQATGGTRTSCSWTRACPLALSHGFATCRFRSSRRASPLSAPLTQFLASFLRAGMRRWWLGATSSRTRRSRLGRAASPAPSTLRRRRCVRFMTSLCSAC
jgi:hypothetical protein